MRLLNYSVSNYRSCLDSSVHIGSNLTCLIGINGAGKSNVLCALLLLKKALLSRSSTSSRKTALKSTVRAKFEHGQRSLTVHADVEYDVDERNNEEVYSAHLTWQFDHISKAAFSIPLEIIHLVFDKGTDKDVFGQDWAKEFVKRIDKRLGVPEIKLIEEVINYMSSLTYYSASQFTDPTKCPISIELEEKRPARRFRFSSTHEQFIYDLFQSYKASSNPAFSKFISTVGSSGIGLIDEIRFQEVQLPSTSYEVKSGGKIRPVEKDRVIVVPSFQIDGNTLSPNQLSEGTFKTLALLFYVITNASECLIIEEPEACVHHGLLNSIIQVILDCSRNKVILMSTHSDYVLDHLTPELVILVTRSPGAGSIAQPLDKYLSREDYRALKGYLSDSGSLGEYWRDGGIES